MEATKTPPIPELRSLSPVGGWDASVETAALSVTAADAKMLLHYAVQAPSSHNTQPWRFQVVEGRIRLFADRTRALPVSDPDERELTISCGCALMNLRVAAAAHGMTADVRLLPNPEDDSLLAEAVVRWGGASPEDAALFPEIGRRRTYRKRFKTVPIPPESLGVLSRIAEQEGALLTVLDSDIQRHAAAKLVSEADDVQWGDSSWREELAAWLRPHASEDGIPIHGLMAPVQQAIVRTFDMGDGVAARDAQLVEGSPVLAILGTDTDFPDDWLTTGQALERILLKAASLGLQASFLNQPIEVPHLRAHVQTLLTCGGCPQILLRLGYPEEELPATPRRVVESVLVNE